MSKTIRILSVVAIALDFIYILVGRIIVPAVAFVRQIYSFYLGLDYWSKCMPAVYVYIGASVLSGLGILFMWIYAIVMIVKAGTDSDRIGFEISGYVLMLGVAPLISGIVGLLTAFVGVGLFLNNAFTSGIYSVMNSAAASLGMLHSVAFSLVIIALTLSLARKKYENGVVEE